MKRPNTRKKRIYILRHGKIEGFAKRSYIGGRTDIPLSAEGRAQAVAWKRFFEGRLPERIFSSDLKRTAETARIIAGAESGNIRFLKEFREIDLGKWEGCDMEEIRQRFPEQWKTRGAQLGSFRPPEGESFGDLARRVIPVFENIIDQADEDFMLIAHAGVNRVIIARTLNMDLNDIFKIPQDCSGLNIIEMTGSGRKLACLNKTADTIRRQFQISRLPRILET